MFHVELAPLGGILGPLKSDLGVFWAKIPLYPYNVKFSNSIFSKSPILPILSFWILNLHIIICQFQKRSTKKRFFVSLHVPATCGWSPWAINFDSLPRSMGHYGLWWSIGGSNCSAVETRQEISWWSSHKVDGGPSPKHGAKSRVKYTLDGYHKLAEGSNVNFPRLIFVAGIKGGQGYVDGR